MGEVWTEAGRSVGWPAKEKVEEEAVSLFGKYILDELKEWYRYTLQKKWRYVVFTARRCYVLALVMETITGEEIRDDDSVEYLTDAALFLHCRELADEYLKYGSFPKILFCDDVMLHGRNTNHIINGMQRELCQILGDKFKETEIEAALVKAIDIHVYTRIYDQLLLSGSYIWKLHYQRKEDPNFFHQLSSDISSLILRSNITNACYIYTEYLSEKDMKRIINDTTGIIHTVYQQVHQYAILDYLGAEEVKAVFSLRIIENARNTGYRVAPFVFLPNLDADETAVISGEIVKRIPQKYRELFADWENLNGKRAFNEIVSLLISNAVMQDFNQKYGVKIDLEDKEKELVKLARNYNQSGFDVAKQMLQELLFGDFVLMLDDLKEMIYHAVSGVRLVMRLENEEEKNLSLNQRDKIRKRTEEYFYNQGSMEEKKAYELTQMSYIPFRQRGQRNARGCGFTLTELNQGYSKTESKYCMAYFLQMIDAGVGGLSSYAPNRVQVVGYSQFVKAGEQSLQIEILRNYKWIPLLSRMQLECDKRMRKLTDEVREYGTFKGWTQNIIDSLIDFTDKLAGMGQTPRDWDGNYIGKLDGEREYLLQLVDQRSLLRNDYVDYAREKYL